MSERVGGFQFDSSITLGNVCQVGVALVFITMWFVSGRNAAEQVKIDQAAFQVTVSKQIDSTNTKVDDVIKKLDVGLDTVRRESVIQSNELKQQISSIPTVGATLANQERQLSELRATNQAEDSRIGALEQSMAGARSDIAAITRASGAQITPGRR